ncbi:MAG TPA: WD40 repeat domain-containing protein [Pseudolabrys sp.]|uniref:WD40 repeat domain-containing protein n=1 Tax=Pseudolabrys sp. TaxID=1960880 RepID=UPI002DDD5FBB|nr:WD40 repeat domain-containing protein [Pseudolabrys sp.]HEV2630098.1 WD40 repeat domain-containing protein [Pseudolabrys sp.]
MSSTAIPSLTDRVRHIATETPIVGVHFFGRAPVFVLGEEHLLFAGDDDKRVPVHGGGILVSAADATRVVTGGDDGKLMATNAGGETRELAADDKKRWIDQVALGPDRAVAWSAGKVAHVITGKGEQRTFEAPSTVAGLVFAPKGFRLAVAHYNGVSFWFPNAAAKPEFFEWKGSHLGVTISPDGRFLVTMMQESTLHGWRIADQKHMRMSGYSARVRSLSWMAGGGFLATSGSEQLILWPFDGKDGPMGRQPQLLAPSEARVTVVAAHPKQPVVAVGYGDGTVWLVRVDDGALITARQADGSPVTALGWDDSGQLLGFGTESGDAGLLTL